MRALIKVWSTAGSIGAEPYTLAMVLADQSRQGASFRFSILGTDISTKVLKTASIGIYPEEMIAPVPMDMRKRYLLRSKRVARPRPHRPGAASDGAVRPAQPHG